jgi:hypothetical protein
MTYETWSPASTGNQHVVKQKILEWALLVLPNLGQI